MSKPTILYIGATRGVSFFGYTFLAEQRPDIQSVLLVRSLSRFQATEEYKSISEDVRARTTFVEGDAHSEVNVRDALKVASEGDNKLVGVVFSIGWRPPTDILPLLAGIVKGFHPEPFDICARGLTTLLLSLSALYPSLTGTTKPKPKLVLCSSMGMGKKAHEALPFGFGTAYNIFAKEVHEDKIAMEVVLRHLMLPPPPSPSPTSPSSSTTTSSPSSSTSPSKRTGQFFPSDSEVLPHRLPSGGYSSLPPPFLPWNDVIVLRPAFLTDGPRTSWLGLSSGSTEKTEEGKKGYRAVQEGSGPDDSRGKGMYSISRADVGDFIALLLSSAASDGKGEREEVDEWWGCQPVLAY